MGIGDFLEEGLDGIKEGFGSIFDGIKSIPEVIKEFNFVYLLISIAITGFITAMFFMPEMMGMKGWPLYIKIVIPAVTLVVSYIYIQIAASK